MANRVLIGAKPGGSGLRVSRPGHDVTNPNLTGQQLAFDSDWLASARIFLSGSIAVPAATDGGQFTEVLFGTTFSSHPAVIATGAFATGVRSLSIGNRAVTYNPWPTSSGQAFDFGDVFRIYTDRILFARYFSSDAGAYTARYIIMRPL